MVPVSYKLNARYVSVLCTVCETTIKCVCVFVLIDS